MGEFLTKLKYDRIIKDDKVFIQLTEPLIYRDSRENEHKAPEGFISDGSSQPKIVWGFIGHPLGIYLESSVIHDYLCFLLKFNKGKSQKEMDWVFLDAMKTQGIKTWRRVLMHRSIRMFGWIYRLIVKDKENIISAQNVED